MKNAKRILALVLSFLMVFTSVPMNVASAANYPGIIPTRSANYNAEVGDTHDFHLYVVDEETQQTTSEVSKLKADEKVIWESSNEDVFTIKRENYENSNETYPGTPIISKAEMLEKGYLEEIYNYKFTGRAKNKIYFYYYPVSNDDTFYESITYYIKVSNGHGYGAYEPTYREISKDELLKEGYISKVLAKTQFTKSATNKIFRWYNSAWNYLYVTENEDYYSNTYYYIEETYNYKIAVGEATFVGEGTAELTATTFNAKGEPVKQTVATIIVASPYKSFKDNVQLGDYENFAEEIILDTVHTDIYEAKKADVEKMQIKDFVAQSFEDEDNIYTLENGETTVTVDDADKDEEGCDYNVYIRPEYKREAKPCHEVIVINYIQGEAGINGDQVSRNEILVNPRSFDNKKATYVSNVDYTYDKNEDFAVTRYIKAELIDATDKANKERDYVLDIKNTIVTVGAMDADTRTRTVTITPVYNRVKVTVNFVYENQTLYTKTMPNKVDNKLTGQEVDAAKEAAKALNKNEATEEVKFKHFVDKDGKEVKLDQLEKMTFTEDTTFTAVYEVKGKTAVKYGYYDADNKFVETSNVKYIPNEELDKAQDKKAKVIEKSREEVKDKEVKDVVFGNEDIKVIFNVKMYQVKYLCDDEEIKTDDTIYYVLNNKGDQENAKKIIRDNKLDEKNVVVEEVTYKNTKRFDVVAATQGLINTIKLYFTTGLVNPVTLVHQLNFHDVDQKIDEVITIGEPVQVEKENNKNDYEKYALDDYVLDKANLGDKAIEVKNDKVVFNYRARLIKVFYNFVDEYGNKVTNEDVTSPEYVYVKFNAYDAFSEESMNQLVKDMAKEIDKYDFKNGTAQGDAQYRAKALDAKENDKNYPDYNVINVNLTYQQNKQAFCKHEYGYVDNGADHSYECLICGLIGEEGIAHEAHEYSYTEHKCIKCGHVQEGVEYKHTMKLVAGLTYPTADGALTIKSVKEGAIDIADALNDSDERAAYIENEKLEELAEEDSEDIAEAILEALENGQNLSKDEEKNAWIVKNVMYQTYYDIYYNMTITLKVVNGTFKQVELKNTPNYDNVVKEVIKDVMRQKSEEGIKLPEDGRIVSITLNGEDAKELAYGNVYDVIARFGSLDDRTEISEFTGKVHLYHQSSKKKKTNTIKVDDPLPLAGGAIADLRNNRPNDNLTRSEFVGVLAQIFSVMDAGSYKPFEDISGDANEASIKKYSTFEIVKGYCDEEFGPNDFITREQMYLILARALKFSGKATALTEEQIVAELAKVLNGEKVSDWATEGVAIAIQKGLSSDANEDPQGNIVRAQAADKLEKFVAIIATTEEKKD